ncbi:extracellular catalytic domain type 1 short-chain-length polyhydroxyalkanoate depolymerase [Ekhidna sp.]
MKKKLILLIGMACSFLSSAQLTQVNGFGSNPGNLDMYIYVPSGIGSDASVVLVMHGCTQNASSYSNDSEWNDLADEYKFYVIYADQPSSNNSSNCFNWFENGDQNRGVGEAASLKSMVDYMKSNYSIDNDKVFVAGFSAGGAMTTVMLAAYPEVFSSGAVMSGLPYDVATGTIEAFQAMFGNVNLSPAQLGNNVRNASSYSGSWPTVAVFHGGSDFIVYTVNETEIMEQWTNVHGIDQTPELDDQAYLGNANVRKREYKDNSGNARVVTYSFNGMGHAIAVDPGAGPTQGGNTGSYATDINFWSSYYAAEFFGILDASTSLDAPTAITASANSFSQIDLNWTDNETNETGYIVERAGNANGPFTTIANLGINATTYSDTGLDQLTTYFYRVSVTNVTSTASGNIVNETTPSDGTPTPPASPSDLNATSNGLTSINLLWDDNSNNEEFFILERSEEDESNYTEIAVISSNTTSYTDQGLISATTYFYRIKAQNAVGVSPYSSSVSASTDNEVTLQTIEQTSGSGILSYFNFNDMGQSFTPSFSGEIVSIDVNLVNTISGSTLRIFSGNTVSGTPIYEQSNISVGSGWQTVSLSNPLTIQNGQQYTFQLTNASIRYSFTDIYSGGNFWYNSISYSVFDAAFIVTTSSNSGARTSSNQPNLQNQKIVSDFEDSKPLEANVYPNPSQNEIVVEFNESSLIRWIEVFGIDGKKYLNIETQNKRERLDLSTFGSGIFLIKVSDAKQSIFKKVIVK